MSDNRKQMKRDESRTKSLEPVRESDVTDPCPHPESLTHAYKVTDALQ